MPQPAWSNKRERQYEHIKAGPRKCAGFGKKAVGQG
jgi:hypothetical protein